MNRSRTRSVLTLLGLGALLGALLGLATQWGAIDASLATATDQGWFDAGLWRLVLLESGAAPTVLVLAVTAGAAVGALVGALRRTGDGPSRVGLALRVVGIACLAASWTFGFAAQRVVARAPDRPNVIWITIDSLRADHLGCYGYEHDTSPFIDSLAERGTRFEKCLSQESYTMASVASYLTSTYVTESRVLYDEPTIDTLHRGFVTIAEVFKNAGYDTASFVFNPHLQEKYAFGQGFDVYDDTIPLHDDDGNVVEKASPSSLLTTAWETVRKMEIKLERFVEGATRHADRPTFLYLHYRDVHGPYVPPAPYHAMFLPEEWGPRKRAFVDEVAALRMDEEAPSWPFRDPAAYAKSQYDGEIRYTDDGLARLFEELPEYGIDPDNTIWVITSDHGEEFNEEHPDDPGGWGHGRTLYAEQVYVPLIVFGPGVEPNVVDTPVELVDVAPTLADFVGIEDERTRTFRGRSLAGALAGGGVPARPVFSGGNHGRGVVLDDDLFFYRFERSVKNGEVYYARRPDEGRVYEYDAQMFFEATDPLQLEDVIQRNPSVTEEYAARLFDWLDTEVDFEVEAVELDAETIEQLRALGYLGDE